MHHSAASAAEPMIPP